jgi:hypothetical protein
MIQPGTRVEVEDNGYEPSQFQPATTVVAEVCIRGGIECAGLVVRYDNGCEVMSRDRVLFEPNLPERIVHEGEIVEDCERCGQPGERCIDPYDAEVNDEKTEVVLCGDCYEQVALDI